VFVVSVKSKTKKKKKKKNKTPFEMDSFYVMDDCKVYRRRDGGEQYWCRIYSDTDKKYIRRSLKTKNKELAIINCKNFYKDVIKLSSSGETIITTSVSSLTKKFLQYQKIRSEKKTSTDSLSKTRLKTMTRTLETVGMFLGKSSRIGSIPREKFINGYEEYRHKTSIKKKELDEVSIHQELQIWKQMVKFGMDRGLVSSTTHLVYPKVSGKSDRRDEFSPQEYRKITRTLNTKKYLDVKHPYLSNRRYFIKYVFLVLCNTGMRTGEITKMLWKHIGEPFTYEDVNTGETKTTVDIFIPRENTKQKKQRNLIVYGDGWKYLQEVKKFSKYTKPNDYVFPKYDGNKWTLNERVFDNLMKDSGVDKTERKLTWTSTRHFYGTKRIEEGVDVYLLGEQMGTSIQMIERHYGHRKIKSQTSQLNIFRKKSIPKKK
jgi:integrase